MDLAKLSDVMVSSNMILMLPTTLQPVAGLALATFLLAAPVLAHGQTRPAPSARAPVVGTISEQAGQVAGPPTPPTIAMPVRGIGTGISLSSGTGNSMRIGTGISNGIPRSRPQSLATGIPLLVYDAPAYHRGGSTRAIAQVSTPVVSEPQFFPTAAPPVWRIVVEERPVQAWRGLCRATRGGD